jgi:hypothetical protein
MSPVQVQFKSITWERNDTFLQRATNAVFLVAISLNFFGVILGQVGLYSTLQKRAMLEAADADIISSSQSLEHEIQAIQLQLGLWFGQAFVSGVPNQLVPKFKR